MKFKVRGEEWILRWSGKLKKSWGTCDSRRNEITLYSKMRPRKQLEISLHEFAHAFFQDADEEVVKKFGDDAADYLWSLGYRRPSGNA